VSNRRIPLLSFGKVHSVIYTASGGIYACDKHNLVGIVALHYGVVDFLHVILSTYSHIVYVKDYESVLYACLLEFSVLEAADLKSGCKLIFFLLLVGKRCERTAESRDIAGLRHLGSSLVVAQSYRG